MIKYYVKKRLIKMLKSGEKKDRYTIALLPVAKLKEDNMAKRVEGASTLSAAEFGLAMDYFSNETKIAMGDGRAVQLGKLGWLFPKINASTVDNKEDATAEKTLKKISYYFQPSKELSHYLNKEVKFHKQAYIPGLNQNG